MIVLQQDLGAVGTGVTAPRLFLGEDGRRYIVKFSNNKLGTKALANEWIGAQLARLLSLRCARGEIADLPNSLLLRCPVLQRRGISPGLAFASRYIAGCRYADRRLMRQIVNKDDALAILLFDHVLLNYDRTYNRKNFLMRCEKKGWQLYAIDHTHLFGSGRWTREKLIERENILTVNKRRTFGWLLKHYLTEERLRPFAEKMLTLTETDLRKVIDNIPQEWLDKQDRDAAYAFLCARWRRIGDITEALLSAADIYRSTERHHRK